MRKVKLLSVLLAFVIAGFVYTGSVDATEEVNKEMIFNQQVTFNKGAIGLDRSSAGMRDFYVLKAAAALYTNAYAALRPYPDGQEKLYVTLDTALAACVASRGDIIWVLPGHTETLTAAQSLDKAGVKIIGLGEPYPVITFNGAIDGFTVDAADITMEHINQAAPGTDAQLTNVRIKDAGDGFTLRSCEIVASDSGDNVVDCIAMEDGADYGMIDDIVIFNNTVAVNSFFVFEGNTTGTTIKNCRFWGDVVTSGIIDDSPASGVDMLTLENNVVVTVGTTKAAVTLDSNPEGLAVDNYWGGTHTTLATNANLGNLMRISRQTVTEQTDAAGQGNVIPAVDAD